MRRFFIVGFINVVMVVSVSGAAFAQASRQHVGVVSRTLDELENARKPRAVVPPAEPRTRPITKSAHAKEVSRWLDRFSVNVGIGVEHINYKEKMPDYLGVPGLPLGSKANVSNMTVDASGEYQFTDNILVGVKAVVPAVKKSGTENWMLSGILLQTNKLKYGWTRVDVYGGYALAKQQLVFLESLVPYLGVRFSWARQERYRFVFLGVPQDLTSTEKIDSRDILVGLRCSWKFADKLDLGMRLECGLPLDVKVTNTAVPGLDIRDKKGYVCEGMFNGSYKLSSNLALMAKFYFGEMHWYGSGWKSVPGGSAKWPENYTQYLGFSAGFDYRF